eukprot:1705130-Pleurochrysis_carterae.AAC.1
MLQSSFRSSVTLQPLSRIHAISEPNAYLEDLSFTWSFHALGDNTCRMDLELGERALNVPSSICPTWLRRLQLTCLVGRSWQMREHAGESIGLERK